MAVTAFSVCSLPVLLLNFVPLLCLGVFGGYEPILGSRFHEVLGRIHPATVGLLMSMSGFPSTLFTFFVPTLVEKIGSRSLMTLGLLLYGFGTFCFGIVPGAPGSTSNWAMQLTALILIGSGWAMCWTPALPCMVDAAALRLRKDSGCSVQAARHHVSPAVSSLFNASAALGEALGPTLGTELLAAQGFRVAGTAYFAAIALYALGMHGVMRSHTEADSTPAEEQPNAPQLRLGSVVRENSSRSSSWSP